jgi:hypothetical protein
MENMIAIDFTRENIEVIYLVTIKYSYNIMARMNDVFRSMLHLHFVVLTMASSPESGYRLVLLIESYVLSVFAFLKFWP